MLDFVTVVFDDEVALLRWQAKSFQKFVDQQEIGTIYIVDNGSQNCNINLDWYGNLQSKVQILTHKDLKVQMQPHIDGWRTQQLCKLLASAMSDKTWAVTLDAKTYFTKKFDIIRDGKPGVGTTDSNIHSSDAVRYLEDYYNIDLTQMIGPGGVPFFFHVETLKEMIASIDNFATWFQSKVLEPNPPHRTFVTEFLLYSAYVKNTIGYDKLYGAKVLHPFNIADGEEHMFEEMLVSDSHTKSIHERAIKKLNKEQLNRWETFLND
tara:strand:+ start:1616 stop:2410 length:795 start_codon:yes stop_codon:yes gene_type:complete